MNCSVQIPGSIIYNCGSIHQPCDQAQYAFEMTAFKEGQMRCPDVAVHHVDLYVNPTVKMMYRRIVEFIKKALLFNKVTFSDVNGDKR